MTREPSRARALNMALVLVVGGASLAPGCKDDTGAGGVDGAITAGDGGTVTAGDSGAGTGSDGGGAVTPTDGGGTTLALTYWNDVAPILFDKCVKCHQGGGIGPFALDNFAMAKKWAAPIAIATKEGRMPPYLVTHDGTCGNFQSAEALTAAEKKKIWDWSMGTQAEGVPATLSLPKKPSLEGGIDFKTPMFSPVAQGGELAKFDEYRCFLMDPALGKNQFITGFEVLPGNAKIVHHVIGMVVNPSKMTAKGKSNAELMKGLDDSDTRIGWPCFGAAGDGVEVESAPIDWAPGMGVVAYPDKMGIALKTSDRMVLQVHYNLADPTTIGMTDQTTFRMRFTDQVERRIVFSLPDPFLESLRNNPPETLPGGQKATKFTWKRTVTQMGLGALPYVDLMAIGPHMHERGRKQEMRLSAGAGAPDTCQAKIEAWNFGWQRVYFYAQPLRLTPSSEITVTCEYDTSDTQERVLPGWGTRNEMCLAGLMLALPPGY